jgi:Permeases of the drug/metabolite transporter (DMT) superfamily
LCLAGISLIWGTTFLAIRIGVQDFPPFLFAGIRQILGGLILTAGIVVFRKKSLPGGAELLKQAIFGFFMITLGNGLVSWAEVFVPSGLAAIICSTMPMLVIFINLGMNKSESPNALIFGGTFLGLSGIVLIFSEYLADFTNINYSIGIILIFIATISWAAGSVMGKRHNQSTDPFLNAGLQMFFGGLYCLPLSWGFDNLTNVVWNNTALYSLAYLILFGSVAAFAMYSYVLTKLPVTIASLYSYINPLVAVILGWLVADEKLNLKIGLAFFITVLGIYLVNRGYQRQKEKLYSLAQKK